MELALMTPRRDVKSLRLAQPAIERSSPAEVTAFAGLTLTAACLWLFVLPVELLALAT